jgi:hypothetical protein
MAQEEKVPYHQDNSRVVPVTVSLAIALFCAIALTMMIHDRWQNPGIKAADQAQHETTGSAANQARASSSSPDPSLSVEPKPPGPAPAQPANPN